MRNRVVIGLPERYEKAMAAVALLEKRAIAAKYAIASGDAEEALAILDGARDDSL